MIDGLNGRAGRWWDVAGRVALPALRRGEGGSGWRGFGYWSALAMSAFVNAVLLFAVSVAVGVGPEDFLNGSREVVMINMVALTVLVWPGVSVAVASMMTGRNHALWVVALYPLAILVFMATFFGKPFAVAPAGGILKLAPTACFVAMSAWLVVEWFAGSSHAHARASRRTN